MEWHDITGYEGLYQITKSGDIKRLARKDSNGTQLKEMLMKPSVAHNGYHRIGLRKNGKYKKYSVHRLVLETFIGPCPKYMECGHLNHNRTDNRLENLNWIPHHENEKARYREGILLAGANHPKAKLTQRQVDAIRILAPEYGMKELARMFNSNHKTISNICKNKSYIN